MNRGAIKSRGTSCKDTQQIGTQTPNKHRFYSNNVSDSFRGHYHISCACPLFETSGHIFWPITSCSTFPYRCSRLPEHIFNPVEHLYWRNSQVATVSPNEKNNKHQHVLMIFIEQDLITKGDKSSFNHV
jgi:hypothetical protein